MVKIRQTEDKELLEELKEKVNPQKFMSPYDPDKVALAN